MSKEIRIQVGIDDISWRPEQAIWSIIRQVDILVTYGFYLDMFMPYALRRHDHERTYCINDNSGFIGEVKRLKLEYKNNVRFFPHGYHHSAEGISVNDEFLYVPYNQLFNRLGLIMKCDLYDHSTFRPPGWKISREGASALEGMGYKNLCLLRKYRDMGMYDTFMDTTKLNLHWCDYSPPDLPLNIEEVIERGRLDVTYHCATFLDNHLTTQKALELCSFVDTLKTMGYTPVFESASNIDYKEYGKNQQ